MKSISVVASFLVLAAVACKTDPPVGTTNTTSAEALPLPPAATENTTPPPAVPELNQQGMAGGKKVVAPVSKGTAMSTATATDEGTTAAAPMPATEETAAPVVAPVQQQGTTTTTTTTVTTKKAKKAAPQGEGFGTGAARGNGATSNGPVGESGGGVR